MIFLKTAHLFQPRPGPFQLNFQTFKALRHAQYLINGKQFDMPFIEFRYQQLRRALPQKNETRL